jgi:hypothetical protein
MMDSLVCSLCKQVMSGNNTKEFAIEVPEISKRLTFKACVACQDKAKTNTLYVCLGCKSVSWYPSGNFSPHGVMYHVQFQCNNCVTQAIFDAYAKKTGRL